MDQTTLIIIVGIVALIVGVLLGKFFSSNSAASQERETMAKELASTQAELAQYKDQVTEHFSKTADLVNNMTESYRDVYQHLAASAEQLGANEQFKLRLEAATAEPAVTDESASDDSLSEEKPNDLSEPKDYAPKEAPNEEGTLAEGFGLKDDDDKASEEKAAEPKENTTPKS